MHIAPSVGICVLLPTVTDTISSLLTLYIKLILVSVNVLVSLSFASESWSPHNVSRCKCKYLLLCIWYGGVYVHEMYIVNLMGCMACTVWLFLMRSIDCVPFEQSVQDVFWNRGISLHVWNTCSSLYGVSKVRPAAYTMYNDWNWISFKRSEMLYTMMDAIWLKVLIEFGLQTWVL